MEASRVVRLVFGVPVCTLDTLLHVPVRAILGAPLLSEPASQNNAWWGQGSEHSP